MNKLSNAQFLGIIFKVP